MKYITLLLAALPALSAMPGPALAAPHDAEVQAVRALYVRFAAEAVMDDVTTDGMMDAPPAVLRQYLTDELVELWLRDRACALRTHSLCRLDFQPIWHSQDPLGSTVRLRWDAARARVVATLGFGDGSARILAYSLVRQGNAWRIADIGYGAGQPTLKQLLSAPEP